jgi:hypothetical protein
MIEYYCKYENFVDLIKNFKEAHIDCFITLKLVFFFFWGGGNFARN